MHITHRDLNDKIQLFILAGIFKDSSGIDYAIPQAWADQLQDMGLENVSAWFVADCTGPSAFPKLHHIGEAYAAILSHRSAAYSETVKSYMEAEVKPPFVSWLVKQQDILGELDAGFPQIGQLIRAFKAGWDGYKKELVGNDSADNLKSMIRLAVERLEDSVKWRGASISTEHERVDNVIKILTDLLK